MSALDILMAITSPPQSLSLCVQQPYCVLALVTLMDMHSQQVSFVLVYSTGVFLLPLHEVVRGKLVRKLLP